MNECRNQSIYVKKKKKVQEHEVTSFLHVQQSRAAWDRDDWETEETKEEEEIKDEKMEEDSKQQMNMTQKEAYKNGDRNGQNSEIYKLT